MGEDSLRELYCTIGTVMDDPQEEKAELGDELFYSFFLTSSDFQYIEEEDEDDFMYFDDFDDEYSSSPFHNPQHNAKAPTLLQRISLCSFP